MIKNALHLLVILVITYLASMVLVPVLHAADQDIGEGCEEFQVGDFNTWSSNCVTDCSYCEDVRSGDTLVTEFNEQSAIEACGNCGSCESLLDEYANLSSTTAGPLGLPFVYGDAYYASLEECLDSRRVFKEDCERPTSSGGLGGYCLDACYQFEDYVGVCTDTGQQCCSTNQPPDDESWLDDLGSSASQTVRDLQDRVGPAVEPILRPLIEDGLVEAWYLLYGEEATNNYLRSLVACETGDVSPADLYGNYVCGCQGTEAECIEGAAALGGTAVAIAGGTVAAPTAASWVNTGSTWVYVQASVTVTTTGGTIAANPGFQQAATRFNNFNTNLGNTSVFRPFNIRVVDLTNTGRAAIGAFGQTQAASQGFTPIDQSTFAQGSSVIFGPGFGSVNFSRILGNSGFSPVDDFGNQTTYNPGRVVTTFDDVFLVSDEFFTGCSILLNPAGISVCNIGGSPTSFYQNQVRVESPN